MRRSTFRPARSLVRMTSVRARPTKEETSAPEQGGHRRNGLQKILELQHSVYVIILYVPTPLRFTPARSNRNLKQKQKTKRSSTVMCPALHAAQPRPHQIKNQTNLLLILYSTHRASMAHLPESSLGIPELHKAPRLRRCSPTTADPVSVFPFDPPGKRLHSIGEFPLCGFHLSEAVPR